MPDTNLASTFPYSPLATSIARGIETVVSWNVLESCVVIQDLMA